jgi:post-segregation antitoxin (ccd killing protein)
MANLTITVDDELLEKVRYKALERGALVNAVLSEYLESFVGTALEQARAQPNAIYAPYLNKSAWLPVRTSRTSFSVTS